MSGKGSRPRPVDRETFAREWERIFAPKTKTTTYDLSLMHVGDWTHVPMGHPVGVYRDGVSTVIGTIVDVNTREGSITIEVDGQ